VRSTWFDWTDAKIDRIRATTPGDAAGASSTPAKETTPLEHVRHCLGLDEAKGDERPTLVYFHWPHDDPRNGKTSDLLCGRVLDDEDSARWGWLFRCVQVDMAKSDPRLVALLGAGDKPSFAFVDREGAVVARLPAVTTPQKFQRGAKDALAKLPAYEKTVQKALADLDASLAQARAAVEEGRLADAKPLYDRLRWTKVRIGPQYDLAVREGWDVDQRLASGSATGGGRK
jgi:hypothetical protein